MSLHKYSSVQIIFPEWFLKIVLLKSKWKRHWSSVKTTHLLSKIRSRLRSTLIALVLLVNLYFVNSWSSYEVIYFLLPYLCILLFIYARAPFCLSELPRTWSIVIVINRAFHIMVPTQTTNKCLPWFWGLFRCLSHEPRRLHRLRNIYKQDKHKVPTLLFWSNNSRPTHSNKVNFITYNYKRSTLTIFLMLGL